MEEIIFDDYDECEIENASEMKAVKHHRCSSGIRKCALALALAVAVSTGFTAVPGKFNNMATVEAAKKKDKKKPVIKFAGKSKINAEVNKSVKIPKTTAKDNKDGNVTKKIAVKVTKGKKQFKTIAKKIKSNKAVKFTSTGNYVITYTVKDKAGNKATKKRYVTVKEAQKEQTTRRPAPARVVPATTEAPTTTEIPTTEASTTEAPTTEASVKMPDMSKYGSISEIEVNGNKYKFIDDINNQLTKDTKNEDVIKYSIIYENWSLSWLEFDPEKSNYFDKQKYLKILGKITVIDEFKKDVSDNVYFTETKNNLQYNISIYFVDSKGILHDAGGFIITPYYSITSKMEDYEFDYRNDTEGYGLHGICNKHTQN